MLNNGDDGKMGCDITDMREFTGESPIHLAAIKGFFIAYLHIFAEFPVSICLSLLYKGFTDIAKLLIENGAYLDEEDAFEFMPIHWAAWTGIYSKSFNFSGNLSMNSE